MSNMYQELEKKKEEEKKKKKRIWIPVDWSGHGGTKIGQTGSDRSEEATTATATATATAFALFGIIRRSHFFGNPRKQMPSDN